MKKVLAWGLSLMLALSVSGAFAETEESIFETMAGLAWSFSSGVGAWSTDFRMQADGSFSGEFHDSEMGDIGEGYPEGTIYGCSFSGRMMMVERVAENIWKLRVEELALDEGQVPQAIDWG